MTKLKVLHLFDDYLPNTQNWIANMLSNCKDIEHHIGAFIIRENGLKVNSFKYAINAIDKYQNIKYYNIKSISTRIHNYLKRRIYYITKGTTPTRLLKYSKEKGIDILHAHFANVGWEFLSLKKLTGLPYFISFYGWDYEMLPYMNPKFNKYFRILFKESKGIICEGKHGANILISKGCPKEKIHIIPLGVDIQKIEFRKRKKLNNKLNLIQVASFTEKKGQDITLKAFTKAKSNCTNMTLTFVGNDKGTKQQLLKSIENYKDKDSVFFKDSIDYDCLHELLYNYDVFIHPSKYSKLRDCEGGAPVVFLDAAATGMPILSTYHCDIPSEVIHNKTGFLVREGDDEKLSGYIEQFYQMDQKTYDKYSTNSRNHVESRFNIMDLSHKLKELYYSI